jgi:S-adenosylmethionine-diacylglycerol 3-amino-3-carboxypropyl transferase
MKPLYNFGLSQEDERTEAAGLGLPGGRLLTVASAGDMPLSLLALGADRVTAVDIDHAQLHLLRLKLGAVSTLERHEAIAFLGYRRAAPERRLSWLPHVLTAVPPDAATFWRSYPQSIERGAVWAGRYERFVRRAVRILDPIVGRRFRALFECRSLEEQEEFFDRRIDGPLLRGAFRLAFHPRVFARRGMDPSSLQHRDRSRSLGAQYFHWFRALCTATPVEENHLLQLHLRGRVLHDGAVPAYLSAEGYRTVRERARQLHVVQADFPTFLRQSAPGSLDGVHLSNLPDWLNSDQFDDVMRSLVTLATQPTRAVWRFLHVDRPLPADVRGRILVDREWGQRLRGADRFPLYTIVPACIVPAEGRPEGCVQ